ncbi:MAG TPA: PIN domain-containing protein [Moheibacter sp.]|nr:PIN domain-containing protein [Moheibacter sp.]
MSNYKVLIDSSVWIEYFKNGNIPLIDQLLKEGFACINDVILTELEPVLKHRKRLDILEGLNAIEKVPLKIDWEIIKTYQLLNLQNGINKVGIPDLIILQQVISEKITLFSFDKHFRLMNKFLNFELLSH